jgi:hypothetical protein
MIDVILNKMADYSKVFPTGKVKSQIRSSEQNIGKLYTTAVDLVAASSAIFVEDLVRRCVFSSSSSAEVEEVDGGGDNMIIIEKNDASSRKKEADARCNTNFILTKECILDMLKKKHGHGHGKYKSTNTNTSTDSKQQLDQDGQETCYHHHLSLFLNGCLQELVQSGTLQDPNILSKYGKKNKKRNLKVNSSSQKQSEVKNKKHKVGNWSSTDCSSLGLPTTCDEQNVQDTRHGIHLLEFAAETQDRLEDSNGTSIIQDEEEYDD